MNQDTWVQNNSLAFPLSPPTLYRSFSPGDFVITGFQRLDTNNILRVAFVVLVPIPASSSASFTVGSTDWSTFADMTATLQVNIANTTTLPKFSSFVLEINETSTSSSSLFVVTADPITLVRTQTLVPTTITLNAATIPDPYMSGSSGFFTFADSANIYETMIPITSFTTLYNYGLELPTGLAVQQTAMQRTNQFCFRPPTGGGWTFFVGIKDLYSDNVFVVSEQSAVSPWLYTNACISVFGAPDAVMTPLYQRCMLFV
jgi:hypothetical protein